MSPDVGIVGLVVPDSVGVVGDVEPVGDESAPDVGFGSVVVGSSEPVGALVVVSLEVGEGVWGPASLEQEEIKVNSSGQNTNGRSFTRAL